MVTAAAGQRFWTWNTHQLLCLLHMCEKAPSAAESFSTLVNCFACCICTEWLQLQHRASRPGLTPQLLCLLYLCWHKKGAWDQLLHGRGSRRGFTALLAPSVLSACFRHSAGQRFWTWTHSSAALLAASALDRKLVPAAAVQSCWTVTLTHSSAALLAASALNTKKCQQQKGRASGRGLTHQLLCLLLWCNACCICTESQLQLGRASGRTCSALLAAAVLGQSFWLWTVSSPALLTASVLDTKLGAAEARQRFWT